MNEAELLFTEILGCSRNELYLGASRTLGASTCVRVAEVLKKRVAGLPLQYILGKTEFMGLEFGVDRNVLIPRPETEVLVETALRFAAAKPGVTGRPRILDLGTGSGCIAVSLAKNLPAAEVHASDVSAEALRVARRNCLTHQAKVRFIRSDLFGSAALRKGYYDVLVSNPPYIPSAQLCRLQPEVRHEPRIALDGGNDGLEVLRRVIEGSPDYLQTGGLLILEIGYGQSSGVMRIFRQKGSFKILEIVKDYLGINRVVVARKKKADG